MGKDFWDGTQWVAAPGTPAAGNPSGRGRARPRASVAIVVGLLALLVPLSTIAASSRGSISVPDGVFGGTTTATVHTGPTTWVHAACYQNGVMVYEQYAKTDSNDQAVLTLGPTPFWPSGAASCTAAEGTWMSNGRFKVSAKTTFSVSG